MVRLLGQLSAAGVAPAAVGVICFFKAQVAAVLAKLQCASAAAQVLSPIIPRFVVLHHRKAQI